MRCLGIDYGKRRIGLALSDPTLLIASPFMVIENRGIKKTMVQLLDIIRQKEVGQIVIGLPLHANGDESEMSREARAFGQVLFDAGLPVAFVDERYTSCAAEEIVGRDRDKKLIDKVAASFILQMYLDERRKGENEGKNQ